MLGDGHKIHQFLVHWFYFDYSRFCTDEGCNSQTEGKSNPRESE